MATSHTHPLALRVDQLKLQLGRVILGSPDAIENVAIALLSGSRRGLPAA